MASRQSGAFTDSGDRSQGNQQSESDQAKHVDQRLIAAMVGHELREPLNAIISFLNVTVQERLGPLNELQVEFLRSTESAARRLERRINDVQVVLLEGDALKLRRNWVNPNSRVVATCRELEWAAEKYEISVLMELEQATRNPGVWADADRLDQVLINLIENAIRYAPTDSEVHVTTSFREHGHWTFTVENAAEDAETRDNPAAWFQAGERSRRASDPHRPGLGLGLTIARHLVHAHGGEIWADIAEGRVRVGFSIPHRERRSLKNYPTSRSI